MLDVHDLLATLASTRPVFHSEADFQHSLAWQLHLMHPTAQIRLEKPYGRMHIDISSAIEGQRYIFELKYKTHGVSVAVDGESFHLQNHGAQPPSRYDFMKDLARLESIVHPAQPPIRGFAVFLTNDDTYWRSPRTLPGVSADFSIHDGRRVSGQLDWSQNASGGTKKNREEKVSLAAEYALTWRDYSEIGANRHAQFRCLVVPVNSLNG